MELFEANTQVFTVKIWLEEGTGEPDAQGAGRVAWRGYITHLPDGERRYLSRWEDLLHFMARYLQPMGIQVSWRGHRVWAAWLQRLRLKTRLRRPESRL